MRATLRIPGAADEARIAELAALARRAEEDLELRTQEKAAPREFPRYQAEPQCLPGESNVIWSIASAF